MKGWRISGWWRARRRRLAHAGRDDARSVSGPVPGAAVEGVAPGTLLRDRRGDRMWRLDRVLDGPDGRRYAILLPVRATGPEARRRERRRLVRIDLLRERMEAVPAARRTASARFGGVRPAPVPPVRSVGAPDLEMR